MNDEQMLRAVGSWLMEGDPEPPDAHQSVRQAMARMPQVRQLGRWRWLPSFQRSATKPPTTSQTTDYQPTAIPAGNGQLSTVAGRTQLMFSPTKAIVAGALVFAIGGVLLIAQPFDQQGGVPGAATDAEVAAPVEFTARWAFGPELRTQTSENVDGVIRYRDGAFRPGVSSEASDPRLTGRLSLAVNFNDYAALGGPQVFNEAFRIVNEEGAWQQMPSIGMNFADRTSSDSVGVFVGEGAYEGLIAVFSNVPNALTERWDLHGYIIDDEVPPPPEPFVEE